MKKSFSGRAILLSVLIMFMVTPVAMGDQIQLYQTSYSSGSGGEFTLRIVENGAGPNLNLNLAYYNPNTRDVGGYSPSFQTFCLEKTEYFSPGATYSVTISNSAVNGGVGPGGDAISKGTAFLYQNFAQGTLTGYNYGDGRSASAGYLQEMIWYLEGESTTLSSGNPFDDMLVALFGSLTAAMVDNEGTYSVAVLNVTDSTGGLHQDQLVLVPEPSTLLLLGAGLLGLGLVVRRRKR